MSTDTIVFPETLSQANQILTSYGLPAFSTNGFQDALAARSEKQIKAALIDLQNNRPGARRYLQNLVIRHGALYPEGKPASDMRRASVVEPQLRLNLPTTPLNETRSDLKREAERDFSNRDVVRVYGAKAALTFEEDVTQGGFHTVALDAAIALKPREYNWSQKTRIQLTRQELPTVIAVIAGIVPQAEYANHGADKNKGFSLEDQGDKVFVKVFAPEGVKAIPIAPEDSFAVLALMMRQLAKNHPGMTTADLFTVLQPTLARYRKN